MPASAVRRRVQSSAFCGHIAAPGEPARPAPGAHRRFPRDRSWISNDHPGELGVAHRSRRGRPAEPGVEPPTVRRQDPTEPLDALDVSVLGDEPEAADRIVSWANTRLPCAGSPAPSAAPRPRDAAAATPRTPTRSPPTDPPGGPLRPHGQPPNCAASSRSLPDAAPPRPATPQSTTPAPPPPAGTPPGTSTDAPRLQWPGPVQAAPATIRGC